MLLLTRHSALRPPRARAFDRRRRDIGGPVRVGRGRHGAAVMDAEVRLLEHALAPFGVLSRAQLARRAHADLWHEGAFEVALRAAVARGVIELLPNGFVAARRPRVAARVPVRDRGQEAP